MVGYQCVLDQAKSEQLTVRCSGRPSTRCVAAFPPLRYGAPELKLLAFFKEHIP